ncbi:hypothetical protein [Spirosoma validum]|uniref:Uncharacterized protein n=1 Tax=Spirosoma validum TaxID=2771355 RepID=A0A927B8K7_9BACT|nr:hypothetical protein [Spirosoma validum]MBD2757731.1 hypothetical protein [Spirosoma validum]
MTILPCGNKVNGLVYNRHHLSVNQGYNGLLLLSLKGKTIQIVLTGLPDTHDTPFC